MGERQRRDELSVLLRTDDDRVRGRTYRQVMGLFAAKAFPQGDGGIRLELTPELEHGDAQKRFTPGEGMFKVEFGPPHEVLDQLRSTSQLAPGQILAVTTFPKRPGTLGHHFFTENDGDATMQKMLLVRLAQCEYDDRFERRSRRRSRLDLAVGVESAIGAVRSLAIPRRIRDSTSKSLENLAAPATMHRPVVRSRTSQGRVYVRRPNPLVPQSPEVNRPPLDALWLGDSLY